MTTHNVIITSLPLQSSLEHMQYVATVSTHIRTTVWAENLTGI